MSVPLHKRDRAGLRPTSGRTADGRARIFDTRFRCFGVRVQPGDFYVTDDPDEMIVTILGSCVAACIRNPATGVGGLNHFMLPQSGSGDWNGVSAAMRYGNYAMEALINDVLKSGCRRSDLEIKLFGGANFNEGGSLVGSQNARFALDYLESEGIRPASVDLGGGHGRRIHYSPATGAVKRLLLKSSAARSVVDHERTYGSRLSQQPVSGDVILFD